MNKYDRKELLDITVSIYNANIETWEFQPYVYKRSLVAAKELLDYFDKSEGNSENELQKSYNSYIEILEKVQKEKNKK